MRSPVTITASTIPTNTHKPDPYSRSVLRGMFRGTLRSPWPWQSTVVPVQEQGAGHGCDSTTLKKATNKLHAAACLNMTIITVTYEAISDFASLWMRILSVLVPPRQSEDGPLNLEIFPGFAVSSERQFFAYDWVWKLHFIACIRRLQMMCRKGKK